MMDVADSAWSQTSQAAPTERLVDRSVRRFVKDTWASGWDEDQYAAQDAGHQM